MEYAVEMRHLDHNPVAAIKWKAPKTTSEVDRRCVVNHGQDFPKMAALLTELSAIPAPGILTRTAREHWGGYANSPDLLDGDGIVHRDPNPTNFVVDGNRAWMVDFGWAVRGPAWMTAANLIASMMEAGWDAADADDAMKAVPAWRDAPPRAVTEFAHAESREWNATLARGPVHPHWEFRADVASRWAEYKEHAGDRF